MGVVERYTVVTRGTGAPDYANAVVFGRHGSRDEILTGEQTIPIAGTAGQLPDVDVPQGFAVTVIAKDTNTGRVYYGGTKVQAEAHTANLDVEDYETFYVTNLNQIWIDVGVGGNGINYSVVQ